VTSHGHESSVYNFVWQSSVHNEWPVSLPSVKMSVLGRELQKGSNESH
jgi:hypothetical protein